MVQTSLKTSDTVKLLADESLARIRQHPFITAATEGRLTIQNGNPDQILTADGLVNYGSSYAASKATAPRREPNPWNNDMPAPLR